MALNRCNVLRFPPPFSWAGDRLQMSTSRHLRKSQGSSPSRQKRCPLELCCCKSLDCISPPPIVSGPRCENSPGLPRKLAWRQILLRACPAVQTNRFNQGWCDFSPWDDASWREQNCPCGLSGLFFDWNWMSDVHLQSTGILDEIQLKA